MEQTQRKDTDRSSQLRGGSLRAAASQGRTTLADMNQLLDTGADINERTPNGETRLMTAVKNHDMRMIKLLVNRGADLDLQDNDGRTAVSLAAKYEAADGIDTKMTHYLLLQGANPYIRDHQGKNAFDHDLMAPTSHLHITRIGYQTSLRKKTGIQQHINLAQRFRDSSPGIRHPPTVDITHCGTPTKGMIRDMVEKRGQHPDHIFFRGYPIIHHWTHDNDMIDYLIRKGAGNDQPDGYWDQLFTRASSDDVRKSLIMRGARPSDDDSYKRWLKQAILDEIVRPNRRPKIIAQKIRQMVPKLNRSSFQKFIQVWNQNNFSKKLRDGRGRFLLSARTLQDHYHNTKTVQDTKRYSQSRLYKTWVDLFEDIIQESGFYNMLTRDLMEDPVIAVDDRGNVRFLDSSFLNQATDDVIRLDRSNGVPVRSSHHVAAHTFHVVQKLHKGYNPPAGSLSTLQPIIYIYENILKDLNRRSDQFKTGELNPQDITEDDINSMIMLRDLVREANSLIAMDDLKELFGFVRQNIGSSISPKEIVQLDNPQITRQHLQDIMSRYDQADHEKIIRHISPFFRQVQSIDQIGRIVDTRRTTKQTPQDSRQRAQIVKTSNLTNTLSSFVQQTLSGHKRSQNVHIIDGINKLRRFSRNLRRVRYSDPEFDRVLEQEFKKYHKAIENGIALPGSVFLWVLPRRLPPDEIALPGRIDSRQVIFATTSHHLVDWDDYICLLIRDYIRTNPTLRQPTKIQTDDKHTDWNI